MNTKAYFCLLLTLTTLAGAAANVRSYGGSATTSVNVTQIGTGHFRVTCNGTYPGVASVDDVTVLATMLDTDNFDVASVSSDGGTAVASPTAITFDVWMWETSDAAAELQDKDFSILVLGALSE